MREYDNGAGDRYLTTQHERDKETGLDYRGARYYDSDVARFLSLDPKASKYPSLSPYNYVAGNPIILIDPNGKEIWIINEYRDDRGMVMEEKVRYCDGMLYTEKGERYTGDNKYFHKVANDLNLISQDDTEIGDRVKILQDSKNIHRIALAGETNGMTPEDREKYNNNEPTGSTTRYDPDNRFNVRKDERTPRVGLAHEFASHAWDADQGTKKHGQTENGIDLNEVDGVNIENRTRAKTGDPKKTTYGGIKIPTALLK